MALTKIHNSNIGESFTEMYGLLMEDDHSYGWATNLKIQHNNGGNDAISKTENLPDSLKYVNDRQEKFEVLPNDIEKVKNYIMNSI